MKPIYLGMTACLSGGGTCHVMDVLIDPSDGTQHYIVLDARGFFRSDVVAPVSAVWLIDERVHLTVSAADLESLPHYNQTLFCRETGLRSCASVRHSFHWPDRAGVHYPLAHR